MKNMTKFFLISTAIDYPSAMPHIGHALEKVQADVMARYKRLQGYEVHFSVGTDEHGLKIERYAKKVNKSPREFVNKTSRDFKNLCKILNISNNDFVRTTEKRHIKTVQKIFQKIYKKGDIYKGKYKGLYCVDCESFYLPKDLENGKCPIHKKPAELVEEATFFFRMSKYQKQIIEHIKKNKNFIVPQERQNEILSRLKEPLQDLNIARKTVKWGIPFFLDKNFTTFVWVEALMNYITTIGYSNENFKKFWPGEIHIGKDILWHHSVIFSSLLLSAGFKLPKTIFIHGFITSNKQKMSKSLGNVISPDELVKKYGTDAVRYFLLREISPTSDGDYTQERFEERYNSDLAKGLGNLTARVTTLAVKFHSASAELKPTRAGSKVNKEIKKIWENYKKAMDEFKFNVALEEIWKLIGFCDRYIEKKKPWENSKNQLSVIQDLLVALSNVAEMLEPFLPETSEKILKQIKSRSKGEPLFPRI